MEMLAAWVPTTPEMEIKVLFGRHVWDCAQHADALGKRAFELRAPLHYSLPPVEDYRDSLREVANLTGTRERVSAFYGAVCPAMVGRYRAYLETTDSLMDEPTVRILETIIRDYGRMSDEMRRLAEEAAGIGSAEALHEWVARQDSIKEVVTHGEPGKRMREERV